ncbi:MAG: outer membrane lipoprotein LolB [Gammaproteobacteria bacterium]|nr:MAG: outer membrane lipoprotein LolB [Gammaproteobacteria bacterium]
MRLFVLILATLFLGACASQAPGPNPVVTDWQQHQSALQTLESWQLEGKLGYRDSRDGGSAWLNWQQTSNSFKLQLNGPFGAGATQILGDDQHAELHRSGKETIYSPSPAALTEQLFGWPWPVDELHYWIRGIPAPHTAQDVSSHNIDGTLATLSQANWQLQFSGYQQVGRWILPGRIRGHSGEYSFTLVIKQWYPNMENH